MANRYWVGGTGTWNTTSTANWSTSSGGPSGASVPTAADSVFFDQSGTYAVTCTGALTCLDFTVSAGTVTIAQGSNPTFSIRGSLFLIAGTVWSASGNIAFAATSTGNTITTNGVTLSGVVQFTGTGGGWTLGSALTGGSAVSISQGSFDSAGFNITCSSFNSQGTSVRSVSLGASTVSVSSFGSIVTFTSTGLTFDAGTSTLSVGSSSAQVALGGLTWYTVSFASTNGSSFSIQGSNTFFNLVFAGRATPGISGVLFDNTQTVTGTLTIGAGATAACRTFLQSSTIGTQRTLNCAGVAAIADVDFRDIAFAGGVSLPITGTRLGDCKGNSNITFDASKTVYCAAAASANWGTSGAGIWSATSGGSADATMFPLAQDVAVITATTPSSGSTIAFNLPYNIGTLDMSARTAATLIINNTFVVTFYGDYIGASGVSLSASTTRSFAGRVLQKITSAGVASASSVTVNSPGGTVQLQDALTITGTGLTTLLWGTLELQSYTLTTGSVDALNGSGVRTLATGTGRIVCAGLFYGASSLTITGSATVSMTSSSPKTFWAPVVTTLTLDQGGSGALTIQGGGTYANITNSYSSTGPTSVIFTSLNTSTFTDFNLTGSPGAVCTVTSSSPPLTATIKKTGAWFVGANSIDGGNNTGLIFTAGGGIDYLSFSNITATRFAINFDSSITEAAMGADTQATRATYPSATSEAATATDGLVAALSAPAQITETATGTDVIQPAYLAYPFVGELLTATDTVATIANITLGVVESASAADVNQTTADLTLGVSEDVSGLDVISPRYDAYPSITEAATATDDIQALRFLPCVIGESLAASEAVGASVVLAVRASELASATDAQIAPGVIFGVIIAEAGLATDVINPNRILSAFVNESPIARDRSNAYGLWNFIDDAEDANWQNINNR
ncbi:hypothetical protein UFOVP393_12 [uncultured Caudovirales phage]|uniref:Uncharacterized protein n=1 Tax=uncultured Caudovirales phage TaxID=2100421 RepID=A0A6J7X3F6_9CAUD|nr:hypothetical protein UFOVP393_12 [uncultured Caudovirales phage]